MDYSSSASARHYVQQFLLMSLGVLAALVALNYQLDPYLIHQWDSPALRQLHPGRERLSAWGKTYTIARMKPQVLYVGNSRTELGLPVDVPALAGKSVFNAALSGASLGDAAAMLEHASHVTTLQTVVWGIDLPSFTTEIGNTDFARELVADNAAYRWQRVLIDMRRAFSIDMTLDSLRLLRGVAGQVCLSSLALAGQRDEACIQERIATLGGTPAVMLPRLREFLRGAGPTPEAMRTLAGQVAALCRQNVQVRLYINPTHAMTTAALYAAGKGPLRAAWLGRLAELGARARALGCDLRVYDFSGLNPITMESVPQAGTTSTMRYFWESSHYRRNVGHLMLARMFDGDAPADFGGELLPSTLAASLQHEELERQRYLASHPYEAQLILTALAHP